MVRGLSDLAALQIGPDLDEQIVDVVKTWNRTVQAQLVLVSLLVMSPSVWVN